MRRKWVFLILIIYVLAEVRAFPVDSVGKPDGNIAHSDSTSQSASLTQSKKEKVSTPKSGSLVPEEKDESKSNPESLQDNSNPVIADSGINTQVDDKTSTVKQISSPAPVDKISVSSNEGKVSEKSVVENQEGKVDSKTDEDKRNTGTESEPGGNATSKQDTKNVEIDIMTNDSQVADGLRQTDPLLNAPDGKADETAEENPVVLTAGEVNQETNAAGAATAAAEEPSQEGSTAVEEGNPGESIVVEEGNQRESNVAEEGNPGESNVAEEGNPGESNVAEEGNPGESNVAEEGNPGESSVAEEGNPGEGIVAEEGNPGESIVAEEGNSGESSVAEEGTQGEVAAVATGDGISQGENTIVKSDNQEKGAAVADEKTESDNESKTSKSSVPSVASIPVPVSVQEGKGSPQPVGVVKPKDVSPVSKTEVLPLQIGQNNGAGQLSTQQSFKTPMDAVSEGSFSESMIGKGNFEDTYFGPSIPDGESGNGSSYDYSDTKPEDTDEGSQDEEDQRDAGRVSKGGQFTDDEDSHFFAYFLTIMVTAIIFYLVFHNKQRIIALIIEGRAPRNGRTRRTSSRARYHKLDNNFEEAITATKGTNGR